MEYIMQYRKTPIVCQHLERTSSDILENYKEIIREYIKGKQGVYALYKKNKLYYVGLASNLMGRLNRHLKDRHQQKWDRFSIYLMKNDKYMKELESLLLRIADPTGNRVKGKLKDSENLIRRVKKDVLQRKNEEIIDIFGGKMKIRKPGERSKILAGRTPILSKYIKTPTKLKGVHKGKSYTAAVRKDGKIRYNGQIYNSPSMVGRAVRGYKTNGWKFWSIKKGSNWIPLDELRNK